MSRTKDSVEDGGREHKKNRKLPQLNYRGVLFRENSPLLKLKT